MTHTQNMYRVGDFVYFEMYPASPYQIRRIEELNKTPSGAVEAKVTCFFRRRDLPSSLLKIADQAERQNKILSKPRKSLLGGGTKEDPIEHTNGEAEGGMPVPKENGLEVMDTDFSDRKPSVEPENIKEEEGGSVSSVGNGGGESKCYGFAGLPFGAQQLGPEQIHELRQKELFLSRIVETLSATQIRGKCTVVILNEVETCDNYLDHEDSYFYSLVYDPANQTLLADKGRIEMGERHQALIPDMLEKEDVTAENDKQEDEEPAEPEEKADQNPEELVKKVEESDREHLVYHPHHSLSDRDIDQFLIVARAVGTFSRALDSSSSSKLPTLHQTASAASRDITILHAMALLHQANYDIGHATKFLVPPPDRQHYPLETDKVTSHNTVSLGGPILCRDQLEEWSAAESALFEDAIERLGKDFYDIRVDCLPWKSLGDIVEYYYMWKTTSRYTELQKAKHVEREKKLKQVYIPTYSKANPNLVAGAVASHLQQVADRVKSAKHCESCDVDEATQWYIWGPANLHLRLCGECWTVWKKKGGLKRAHEFETYDLDGASDNSKGGPAPEVLATRFAGSSGRNGLPPAALKNLGSQILVSQKGRVTFYLNSALEARIARRLAPKQIFNVRKAARSPFKEVNSKAIQDYYYSRPVTEILHTARQVKRGIMSGWAIDYLSKLHKKRQQQQQYQNG